MSKLIKHQLDAVATGYCDTPGAYLVVRIIVWVIGTCKASSETPIFGHKGHPEKNFDLPWNYLQWIYMWQSAFRPSYTVQICTWSQMEMGFDCMQNFCPLWIHGGYLSIMSYHSRICLPCLGGSSRLNPYVYYLPEIALRFTAVKVALNPLLESLWSERKLNQSDDPVEIISRGADKSPVRVTNKELRAEGPS